MATGDRIDPFVNYNFHLEIDGISRAAFHEVTGLESSIDVIEHREGGWNTTPFKFPGQAKYANIVLRWGMATDRDLYDWHMQWLEGAPAALRKSGSIVLLDRAGKETMRWNFNSAWPCKWSGPAFNAESSDIAIESIELAHEGVKRA
jgi:phage tail-like protein